MAMTRDCDPRLIDAVLTAATDVHRALGAGLLESVYERALLHELRLLGIPAETQAPVSVRYKGRDLGVGFRLDLLIDRQLIVEVKSVRRLDPTHVKQLVTYLRLSDIRLGYILNFNCPLLKHGIKRVSLFDPAP
jgi:GxxExxY protein